MDLYWAFGPNYNQFDPGNEQIDREAYTIDNPLFEYRKDVFFGFEIRLGLTIGLNFGNGR